MDGLPLAGASPRAHYVRRGITLEWVTVAYNSLEGLIALAAGMLAGSVALVGFGFDSALEVAYGATLLWRLQADHHPDRREHVERQALRLVGWCFVLLAIYVAYDAGSRLITRERPETSTVGLVLAVASLIVMPLLARAKRRVAGQIQSVALTADATQTQLCTYLSAILLAGLGLNATLGWWWADPLAALIMVPVIAKEGYEALRGKTCCTTSH